MALKDPYYIGIDVGTQSVRAGLITSNGSIISTASMPIKTWNLLPGFYEQSTIDIWEKCLVVIKKITDGIDKNLIGGIGFDATCSLAVFGKDFEPISVSKTGCQEQNIILWMDHRAVKEAEFITSLSHSVLKFIGGKMSPEMEPPKLLWIKKHLPEQWNKAKHFFDLPDFLTWRATGSLQRSLCSLVCKWTYQAGMKQNKGWQDSFWNEIGLEDLVDNSYEKIGTNVLVPGQCCGQGLSKKAAEEMGLNVGTPVSASIIDAHAGGLGVLLCSSEDEKFDYDIEKRMALICGTSTCHMKVNKNVLFTPGIWGPYYSAMVPDYWCSEAGQSATGALLDHIINSHPVSKSLKNEIKDNHKYSHITDLLNEYALKLYKKENLSSVSLLTKDYHVWPDYHGNRSPLANPDLKGMICGLTLAEDKDDLTKQYIATIQALAYSTKHIIEVLEKSGHSIKILLVCGGLAKNSLYVQMHADITEKQVIIPNNPEPVLLGAAILGACAAKNLADFRAGDTILNLNDNSKHMLSTMKKMSGKGMLVKPNLEDKNYHKKKYHIFQKMLKVQEEANEIMKL